jgi:hypothetical protein
MSRTRVGLVGIVAAGLMLMTAGAASAAPTVETEFDNIALGNSWWLESPTQITTDVSTSSETESRDGALSSYNAQIRQPINPDGTSTWPAKRGVIPVQFNLTAAPATETRTVTETTTAVTKVPSFQSIGSDSDPSNDWSALTYVPPTGTQVGDINALIAHYGWINGTNHGGSLRWQINTSVGTIHVYYGPLPNFTSNADPGAAQDLADETDNRVDTSQVGGTFYDNWANVRSSQFASLDVGSIALTVDGGAGGDQNLNLMSALVRTGSNESVVTVADSYKGAPDIIDPNIPTSTTFPAWVPGPSLVESTTGSWVAGPAGTPVQTNAIPAKILVEKYNDGVAETFNSEELSSAQGDTTGTFRQVDGKYIYNLKAETLGKGDFKVFMVINGQKVATSPGVFTLR